ncbi:MAG: M16 family metallopeptidase [Janthinobacterium lividum]
MTKHFRFPAFAAAALAFLLSPAHAAEPAAPVKTTLLNGLRIICKQETSTPLIAIDVFIRAGAPQETASTAGIGSFVAHALLDSTITKPPATMTSETNALGGNIAVTWHPDWTQVSALTVSDKYKDAIFLLADVLQNADFDPDAVEGTRQQILSELDSRDADQFQTAYGNLQKSLYAGTSYARPDGGTPETISRLTQADLLRYYSRFYVPKNIVFVVVGNIKPEDAEQVIAEDLEDFPRPGPATAPNNDPLPPLTEDLPATRVYAPDISQNLIMAGYRAAPIASPDYFPLLVANALFGGMKSGRLFTQLREQQGLAYDLGSVYDPHLAAAALAGYVFGAPTKTDPITKKDVPSVGLIKNGILTEAKSLITMPPTPGELARAQHFLIGTYALSHERLEDRASLLGAAELSAPDGYKLDTDYNKYISAVTAADVQRVAAKYFVHPVISTVEPDTKSSSAGADTGG